MDNLAAHEIHHRSEWEYTEWDYGGTSACGDSNRTPLGTQADREPARRIINRYHCQGILYTVHYDGDLSAGRGLGINRALVARAEHEEWESQ